LFLIVSVEQSERRASPAVERTLLGPVQAVAGTLLRYGRWRNQRENTLSADERPTEDPFAATRLAATRLGGRRRSD
jgi:hypothetical protein